MKQTTKKPEHQIFRLRVRLVVLVAIELVASVFLAVWISNLLDRYIPASWDVPFLLYLVVVSLFVGVLVTVFLSKLFFEPVKRLRYAMAKVAEGDFTIQLHTKSNSREVRDIYAGFNLMTQELRSTEILQTDFVSNVSHEFKTPLGAIEGYSTLLQDCENLTPQQQTYVEKIIFNTQRLSSLTGSILLLSKLENQQIPTGQSRFFLDEQIRQTIVALEPAWSAKDIEFDVDMDEVAYFGNELLMRHVWSNLLSNAVKFSLANGVVQISLKKTAERIVFTVRDYGPGIPDDAMKHIFTRFYQGDSSHKQEGNGLGLALVDRILQLENGKIAVENCHDGGCEFTVYLQTDA